MFSEKVRVKAEAYAKNKVPNSGWDNLRDEIKTAYMDGARYGYDIGYRAAMTNGSEKGFDLNVLAVESAEIAKKRAENGGTEPFSTQNLLKHCATEVVEAMEAWAEYRYVKNCGVKAEPEQREGVDGYKMDGYKVVYEDGYESWSPKETLESAYHGSGKMSFSEALYALKRGAKIARSGWNGKGMFLTLQAGSEVDGSLMRNDNAKNFYGDGKVKICPHIDMKAADGSYVVGWLASQTDMLADDWCIVE